MYELDLENQFILKLLEKCKEEAQFKININSNKISI